MKRHWVECDEGTYPAQTLERFRHEVWMGEESQTDEGASRQVKLSEKGEHKIEGDAANKDVAIEGLWTVQNTTQALALVIGNGSKNEMHQESFSYTLGASQIGFVGDVSREVVFGWLCSAVCHHGCRGNSWCKHKYIREDDGTRDECHQRCNPEGHLSPTGSEGDTSNASNAGLVSG